MGIRNSIKSNSSLLFAFGATAGTLTTAYLAARAGYQTAHALESEDPHAPLSDKARRTWRLYIPVGVCGTVTIACIVGSKRVDGARALAAQAALTVSQRAYSEYRDQVIEEFGDRKDKTILAKVAEKRVAETPPPTIVAGGGTVLCCELFTGRYFLSDHQSLTKAVNEVNAKMLKQDYATLDCFYYEVGLQTTSISGHQGWLPDKLLELEISTVLHNGVPAVAFDYNYLVLL